MKYVVVIGNPGDGFTIYGPFQSMEIAVEWAENIDDSWWVFPLNNKRD